MSNDVANCGCEGHADNQQDCKYDKLTDLAMESFPELLVRDTKDIEELILAGGVLLKAALTVIKSYGENEGYVPADAQAAYALLEEAGLV